MLRIILGIIVGFVVWSILWVGSDIIIAQISPHWYGNKLLELQWSINTKTPYTHDSTILLISLIRSVIFSLIAGYIAALVAGENKKSTLGLGILLVAFGIFIQSIYWNYMPLWYHIPFLALLIPVTYLGGKLRKA
jgi:hypothetical protein